MTALLFALLATVVGADGPSAELFAFDNAVGRGQWTPAQQAATLKDLGLTAAGQVPRQTLDDFFRQLGASPAIGTGVLGTRLLSRATNNTRIRETAATQERRSPLCSTCERNAHSVTGGV